MATPPLHSSSAHLRKGCRHSKPWLGTAAESQICAPTQQELRVLCASSHQQRDRGNRQWPRFPGLSRVTMSELGACPHSAGIWDMCHLYSHHAAEGFYLPIVASHQAPHMPQAPASREMQRSSQAPHLHWQSTGGGMGEKKLRGCRAAPRGADTQQRRARTGVNTQEAGRRQSSEQIAAEQGRPGVKHTISRESAEKRHKNN